MFGCSQGQPVKMWDKTSIVWSISMHSGDFSNLYKEKSGISYVKNQDTGLDKTILIRIINTKNKKL